MKQVLFLISFISLQFCSAQTHRFKTYGPEQGITQNFIYSIDQDEKGYIWIGTGEGVYHFDGKHFKLYLTKDGLAEDVVTSSYQDKDKSIYFGHNAGGLSRIKSGIVESFKGLSNSNSSVKAISEIDNQICFITQNDGLQVLYEDSIQRIPLARGFSFYSMHAINESLLIGTENGLYLMNKENGSFKVQEHLFKGEAIPVICPLNTKNEFLIISEESGMHKLKIENNIFTSEKWHTTADLSGVSIQCALQDAQDNIWLGTYGEGIIKLHHDINHVEDEISRYNSDSGMSNDFVHSLLSDREGNLWIGSFGSGLSTLMEDFFLFYSMDEISEGNDVHATWSNAITNTTWLGTDKGLIRIQEQDKEAITLFNDSVQLPAVKITSIYGEGNLLWVGTKKNSVFEVNLEEKTSTQLDWGQGSLAQTTNKIVGDGKHIWVATNEGIAVYDNHNNEFQFLSTKSGLSHNLINTLYVDEEQNVWIGTYSNTLQVFHGEELSEYPIEGISGVLDIMSITQDNIGSTWFATSGSGVFRLIDGEFINYRISDGLGSDYCYSIACDKEGKMWVGHRDILSHIDPKTSNIITYDKENGISGTFNRNAMMADEKGYVWMGTSDGVIRYDASKTKQNHVAPIVSLSDVFIEGESVSFNEGIKLKYGEYRFTFDFIGVNFRNPEKITYQYMLEGYDKEFGPVTNISEASYGRVSDGEYVLHVRACNEDGVCSDNEILLNIAISIPVWKEWWFIVICIVLLVSIVYFIIKYRERRQRYIRKFLKQQLDEKTAEVRKKADKIEEINQDLFDSINYAQNIQYSMLPEVKLVEDCLPNSFVYYAPKDIVSGDFYFFEKIENKLIIACADCTGHGVPGGFMSMIGSVTLSNIYDKNKYGWRKPHEVLSVLDKKISTILNQGHGKSKMNGDALFKSRDGMDISLCEIDLDTNEVLISSAKFNSIIRQNGELHRVSGDRKSIGDGLVPGSKYSLHRFQMKKGDALFLFSDGYTDQFGGENGKKLKLSGTKSILESLNGTPSKYANIIQNKFEEWKDDYEQVDDVLFIGLVF